VPTVPCGRKLGELSPHDVGQIASVIIERVADLAQGQPEPAQLDDSVKALDVLIAIEAVTGIRSRRLQ
jgi:hypothetical protein